MGEHVEDLLIGPAFVADRTNPSGTSFIPPYQFTIVKDERPALVRTLRGSPSRRWRRILVLIGHMVVFLNNRAGNQEDAPHILVDIALSFRRTPADEAARTIDTHRLPLPVGTNTDHAVTVMISQLKWWIRELRPRHIVIV